MRYGNVMLEPIGVYQKPEKGILKQAPKGFDVFRKSAKVSGKESKSKDQGSVTPADESDDDFSALLDHQSLFDDSEPPSISETELDHLSNAIDREIDRVNSISDKMVKTLSDKKMMKLHQQFGHPTDAAGFDGACWI